MTDTRVAWSIMTFFLFLTLLLPMAGFTGSSTLEFPTSPGSDDTDLSGSAPQKEGFFRSVGECSVKILTIGLASNCDIKNKWSPIDRISDVLGWVGKAATFLFQLFTFQIDGIPVLLSVFIVIPAAIFTAMMGINLIRGRSG